MTGCSFTVTAPTPARIRLRVQDQRGRWHNIDMHRTDADAVGGALTHIARAQRGTTLLQDLIADRSALDAAIRVLQANDAQTLAA